MGVSNEVEASAVRSMAAELLWSRRAVAGRSLAVPWPLLACAGVLTLLALLADGSALGCASTCLVGRSPDAAQQAWFLAWTPTALSHGHNPLLTHAINAPQGANLMVNTAMPLLGVLAWPITALAGATAAYDALVVLCMPLAGVCAYAALRRLVDSPWAACAGGLFYGVSPFVLTQVVDGHLNLAVAAFPPLLVVVLHEMLVRRGLPAWRTGVALGALVAAQLLVMPELLLLAAVAAVVVLGCTALLARDRLRLLSSAYARRALAWAAVVVAIVGAYPLYLYFAGPLRPVGPLKSPPLPALDLANLVRSTAVEQLHIGGVPGGEASGFLGLPLLALLAYGVWRGRRSALVRVVAASSAVVAVLALGPRLIVDGHHTGIPLPWLVATHLPLLREIVTVRFTLLVDLGAAVVLAVVLAGLRDRGAHAPMQRLGVAGAVALTAVSLLPARVAAWNLATPAWFSAGMPGVSAGEVVAVMPMPGSFEMVAGRRQVSAEAMAWTADGPLHADVVGGYVLHAGPRGTVDAYANPTPLALLAAAVEEGRAPQLTPQWLAAVRRELVQTHVGAVVVGPMAHQAEMLAALRAVLGRPGHWEQGVWLWTDVPGSLRRA